MMQYWSLMVSLRWTAEIRETRLQLNYKQTDCPPMTRLVE